MTARGRTPPTRASAAPAPRGATLTERKRAAILQAAIDAFRDEGFHATSMDRIAERAAVSKRTLYNHFASKDALFDVVIEGFWSRLTRPVEAEVAADLPVDRRLAALARSRLQVLLDPEVVGVFRVVLSESMRAPDLGRAYRADRAPLEMLGVHEVIADEVARGSLRVEDPTLAAMHYWGLVFEGLFWPVVLGLRGLAGPAERDRVIAEGVKTFLARYGATPATSAPPAAAAPSGVRPRATRRNTRGGVR